MDDGQAQKTHPWPWQDIARARLDFAGESHELGSGSGAAHSRDITPQTYHDGSSAPREKSVSGDIDKLDISEHRKDLESAFNLAPLKEEIVPTFVGFKAHVRSCDPRLPDYLVERLGQEQLRRYKRLLSWKVEHAKVSEAKKCSSGTFCAANGGGPRYFAPKAPAKRGKRHAIEDGDEDGDEDENSVVDGIITEAQFPVGLPLPPANRLPAEFECPFCFQVKKFHNASDWTKHVYEDLQPFTCTFEICPDPKSFKRKADWVRHENERHRQLEWWQCTEEGCTHLCYRRDNFIQHLVREHKLPEPKVKNARSNKSGIKGPAKDKSSALGYEDILDVPLEDRVLYMVKSCRRETAKNPLDEPCRFCGNHCNSFKKLTVHLARHMEYLSLPILQLIIAMQVSSKTDINAIDTEAPLQQDVMGSLKQDVIGSSDSNLPIHRSSYSFDLQRGRPTLPPMVSTTTLINTMLEDNHPWNGAYSPRSSKQDSDSPIWFDSTYGESLGNNKASRIDGKTSAASKKPQLLRSAIVPTDSGYASMPHRRLSMHDTEMSDSARRISGGTTAPDHIKDDAGLFSAPTAYSASFSRSLPRASNESYISDLAKELFAAVAAFTTDEVALGRVSQQLPDLLRAFALKIGYKPPNQIHCDVSYFIHKYRSAIQSAFESEFRVDSDDESMVSVEKSPQGEFAIGRFLAESTVEFEPPTEKAAVNVDHPEVLSEEDPLDTRHYRDFVRSRPEFDWLVGRVTRGLKLAKADPDVMESIHSQILKALPSSHKVSRRAGSQEYCARILVKWDPRTFVRDQRYASGQIEHAITLTGTYDNAQALSAVEYLRQTWPTGEVLIAAIKALCEEDQYQLTLPDGTSIKAKRNSAGCIFDVLGTGDAIAEVTQQLAWSGAGLRTSPYDDGVAVCTPTLKIQPTHVATAIDCMVDFHVAEPISMAVEGSCWHHMFRNPVLVRGFPILAKSSVGLELPLNMMAKLVSSDRATEFDGQAFLKGFSTMAVATQLISDLLMWHYIYHPEGERLTYLDEDVPAAEVSFDLGKRHVVGWCASNRYYAGASDADYDVEGTRLPRRQGGCLLQNVSLSAGKIVTGGAAFALGVKDLPPHLTRNSYIPTLQYINTVNVVLWDERDKRGWLVNGTSALLHLVRTALQGYSTDDFSSAFLLDTHRIREGRRHRPNSAVQVLIDEDNRELEIYPGRTERYEEEEQTEDGLVARTQKRKRSAYLFEDLVTQFCTILDQIVDHQIKQMGRNGIKIKCHARRRLEGWDFVELATGHDPAPRVAQLEAYGYGWVDLVRSIDAVVLFGWGFGDLIRPGRVDALCPQWRSLPTRRYYLAMVASDLRRIMAKHGNERVRPMQPAPGLVWHSARDLLGRCICQTASARQLDRTWTWEHHDPVQSLLPSSMRLFRIKGPDGLDVDSAVIFGHNMSLVYRWQDQGEELTEVQTDQAGDAEHLEPLPGLASVPSNTASSGSRDESSSLPSETSTMPTSVGSSARTAASSKSTRQALREAAQEMEQHGKKARARQRKQRSGE